MLRSPSSLLSSLLAIGLSTRNVEGEPDPWDSSPVIVLVPIMVKSCQTDNNDDEDMKKRTASSLVVLFSRVEEEHTNCRVNYN